MPVSPAACSYTNVWVQAGETQVTPPLQPGRYCGGLRISGTADFAPGVYIIADGDFAIGSQAVITGEEVTFVLTGATPSSIGNVTINGGAEITLTPTTTGEMARSEEHTSELQSLMRISYAVFCLKKQKKN